MRIDVALVPPTAPPAARTCIVIDVLRATSVIATLFGRGLRQLYPAAGVTAARALRADLGVDPEAPMLCGEVDALPPAGFDFGNSPVEFDALAALPAGRAVVATSNGTPALLSCAGSPLVLAAAPLNAGAAARAALEAQRDVLVVCAGSLGAAAEDDRLAAGLLVHRLAAAGADPGPEAAAARDAYLAVHEDLAGALRATEHGRRLVELGFGADVDFCATTDRYDVAAGLRSAAGVPRLELLPPSAASLPDAAGAAG